MTSNHLPLTLIVLAVVGVLCIAAATGSVLAVQVNESTSGADDVDEGPTPENESAVSSPDGPPAVTDTPVPADRGSGPDSTISINGSILAGLPGTGSGGMVDDAALQPFGVHPDDIGEFEPNGPGPSAAPIPSQPPQPTADSVGGPPLPILQPSGGMDDGASPQGGGMSLGLGLGGVVLVAVLRRGVLLGGTIAPAATVSLSSEFDRLVRMLAPLRYSRFDDSDPLEHETRREVLGVVEDEPGTYLSAVAEGADVPLSTARHHVRILEREGLVVSAKVRGKRRFFTAEVDDVSRAAAIEDGAAADVLDALDALGPSSVADLAEFLDRDSSTVTYHLQRLAEDDLVARERDGRAVVNRLSDAIRDSFDSDRPAGPPIATIGSPADD